MSEDAKQPTETTAAASGQPEAAPRPKSRRRWIRTALLVLGPIAVVVAGTYIYLNTGRYSETDNAYVKADVVIISAEVAGPILTVAVRENERVRAGEVLFEIDDSPYKVAVERAEAQMEAVSSFIKGLQASYQQRLEELALARTNVAFTERELARQQSLAERQLGSDAEVDRAHHEFDIATQQIPIIEQALAQLRAQLGGGVGAGLEAHAAYRTVRSMRDSAVLDLEHAVVRAPFDGVASRVPKPGQYVAKGGPVMSIVSDHDVWVEANYKETELTHVDVGQPAVIRLDTYPDREWRGRVESISQATGAEFSVIPAQNASGNWVKVAQRIPVRIALETRPGDPPLRAGMSAIVEIDTGFQRPAPGILSFLQTPVSHETTTVADRN